MEDADLPDRGFAQASEALREAAAVSLFVRFHPLLNSVCREGLGTLVDHGETVGFDLEQTSEEALAPVAGEPPARYPTRYPGRLRGQHRSHR